MSDVDDRDLFGLVLIELPGTEVDAATAELIQRYPVGGAVLFRHNLRSAPHAAQLNAELGTWIQDPILSIDQEGGTVVRLLDLPQSPSAMALGAGDDVGLTEEVSASSARSLRSLGFNLNFAPVADVNVSVDNPVIGIRAFGSSPENVAAHVRAWVRGHQAAGVAACAKHFPGHGDTRVDSHMELPVLPFDRARLDAVELPPFIAAIEEGCATIMPGHLMVESLDDRLASLSPVILEGLLRRELGFEGVIVTDALNMGAITRDFGDRGALECLLAGADLLLVLGDTQRQTRALNELDRAFREGRIPIERIRDARRRVDKLREKFPSRPDHFSRSPADEVLMDTAAQRAVTRLGEIEPLRRDESILIVARAEERQATRVLAATDLESIATAVHRHLRSEVAGCELVLYPADQPMDCKSQIESATASADRVLWLSASRLRPRIAERELAVHTAGLARSWVHVAVYSPYAALDIPGPAVLTYGYRDPALRALVRALKDPSTCSGKLPIELGLV